jgi:outer membrane lipoprotein LolB
LYQITQVSTHYIVRIITLLMLCTSLSACFHKTLPIAAENPTLDWSRRSQKLQSLSTWTLLGKAAFQSPKESGSASFEWQQQQDRFSFATFNPLGSEEFRLQGVPGQVKLYMANGKEYSATNSETLFVRTVGFQFPFSSLKYWVRGIPDPTLPANTKFDVSHRLARLEQANWSVDFQNYTTVNGIDLPRFIIMSSSLYKAKVMIYEWRLS